MQYVFAPRKRLLWSMAISASGNYVRTKPIERQQSIHVVIAEASQSTRYGTGSVAETAIRDLLTQTPREFLASSERKEKKRQIEQHKTTRFLAWLEKKRRKRQHKQQWTTKRFLAGLGTERRKRQHKQQWTTKRYLAGLGTERRKRQLEQQ